MQLIKSKKISSWLGIERVEEDSTVLDTICKIPIHSITPNPYQPRCDFDEEGISELAESIKKYGLLQPITVRRLYSGDYELVAGERRLRACSLAGMLKIPASIVALNDNDSAIVALIENIQRENLSFLEEAQAYRNLLYTHGLTQEELACRLGKNQSSIANKVRLLKLSKTIREIIKENKLSERHARALLRLDDEAMRIKALEKICDGGLNVKQTDELIDEMCKPKEKKDVLAPLIKPTLIRDMKLFSNTLRHAIDLMKRHGIEAVSVETEYEDYIEYTITVPKTGDREKIS